jgi:hypothetical protein
MPLIIMNNFDMIIAPFSGKQTSLDDEKAQKLITTTNHFGNIINSLGPAQFFPSLIKIVPKFKKLMKEAKGLAPILTEEFEVKGARRLFFIFTR